MVVPFDPCLTRKPAIEKSTQCCERRISKAAGRTINSQRLPHPLTLISPEQTTRCPFQISTSRPEIARPGLSLPLNDAATGEFTTRGKSVDHPHQHQAAHWPQQKAHGEDGNVVPPHGVALQGHHPFRGSSPSEAALLLTQLAQAASQLRAPFS